MDIFGNVRNKYNRLEDFGYGFSATGDSADQARIDQLNTLINDQAITVKQAYDAWQLKVATQNIAQRNVDLKAQQWGSLCSGWDTKKKCDEKRDRWRAELESYKTALGSAKAQTASAKNNYDLQNQKLTEYRNELASLLEAIELEAQATVELAEQGKTREQIRIEAQAKADATKRQAQQRAEEEDRKSKSKKVIILSIVFAGLLLGGFWAFMAIRKKSK
jgi:hypothetical protein